MSLPFQVQILIQWALLQRITASNSGDASLVVDITKLSWDIDGAGDNTMTLASADVASILVEQTIRNHLLLMVLQILLGQELHALADFGGTSATGGVADTIDVAIGFLSDTAGNVSTGLASPVANAEVTLADVAAPISTVLQSQEMHLLTVLMVLVQTLCSLPLWQTPKI